jgi:hypothetical protein
MDALTGNDEHPTNELRAYKQTLERFDAGAFEVLIDGQPATSLDQLVRLTRRTGIAFVVAAPAPVLVDEFQTVVEA